MNKRKLVLAWYALLALVGLRTPLRKTTLLSELKQRIQWYGLPALEHLRDICLEAGLDPWQYLDRQLHTNAMEKIFESHNFERDFPQIRGFVDHNRFRFTDVEKTLSRVELLRFLDLRMGYLNEVFITIV